MWPPKGDPTQTQRGEGTDFKKLKKNTHSILYILIRYYGRTYLEVLIKSCTYCD